MENAGFSRSSVFFYLIALQNDEDYEREESIAVIPVATVTLRKSKPNMVKRPYLFSMTVIVNSCP